ncbi:hypothetical protein AYI82_06850 [Shewanella algae]|uniref:restriction endonuclease subunit S n=1 Tax=Shewanella algae TaxID=38313 RepID=UPI00118249B3|nr:restriction endonuclease subunit S [Shewanella algae]TVL10147.1 hypothetical protein AYI82_06850 [Shewanella algae]
MSFEWKSHPLHSVGRIVTGKTPSSNIEGAFDDQGIPFITPSDMDGRRCIDSTVRYLSEVGLEVSKKYLVPEGSVAVSCIGSDMGKAVLVGQDSVTNQQINTIIVDESQFNPVFVYYVLSTMQQELKNIASGSATPILNKTHFGNVEIRAPKRELQNKIVSILEPSDLKITLNTQTNQTLEQMAQALFKSWFVDFDPVIDNALDSGFFEREFEGEGIPEPLAKRVAIRQALRETAGGTDTAAPVIGGLPSETRALFPDSFEEHPELGWIPKGWGAGCLADIASYTSNRIATAELSLSNYVSTENMLVEKKGIVDAANLPTVNTVPAYTTGNVLISNIRPYFKKIWMANGDGGHSNDVLGFVAKHPSTEGYLFNLLYQDALFDFMMTTSKGSKMPRGDKKAIMGWPVVIPPSNLRVYFSERVGDFYVSNNSKVEENKTLANLRDTLLPKLLSGELTVLDVCQENQVESKVA